MGESILSTREYRAIFSNAAALLASCGELREALQKSLDAFLPALGDFGFFDARVDETVTRIAAAHEDPATLGKLRPTRWAEQDCTARNLCALSSGKPALHTDIDDAWYRSVAANEGHLALLRALAFRSMITVPMHFRGELIGAFTLFMGRSGRCHTAEHLELAIDLAGLAAPVVANAALRERHERALAELRISEERLRMSVRAAGIGTWEWNLHDNSVYWSPEYREIYGFSAEEPATFATGMSVVAAADAPKIERELRAALADGGEFDVVHRIRHATRGERWLQSVGRPVVDASGKAVRVMGVVTDVTERNRRDRELQELREHLAEELQAMQRLHQVSSRHIRREDRLEDLLLEILDTALDVTGRQRGAIHLVDTAGKVLRVAAQRGFSEDFVARVGEVPKNSPLPAALAWRAGSGCWSPTSRTTRGSPVRWRGCCVPKACARCSRRRS